MKFCSECGSKLPDGAKFCGECGTRVNGGSAKDNDQFEDVNGEEDEEDTADLIDEEQSEKIKDLMESLKEDADCDRIHIVGEDGFDELVASFAEVFKMRSGIDDVIETFPMVSIALIDNSKTGHGKRGTLITRMGLFIIDKDIPNIEDGREDDGCVPWQLFAKFAKPFDDENYCLLNVDEFNASDEVEDSVKEDLEYSDKKFFLRFSRTGLTAAQIDELISSLKEVVECDAESDDEDEENVVDEPPTFEDEDGAVSVGDDEEDDEEEDDDEEDEVEELPTFEDDEDVGEEEDESEDASSESADDDDNGEKQSQAYENGSDVESLVLQEVLDELGEFCDTQIKEAFAQGTNAIKAFNDVEKLSGESFAKKLSAMEGAAGTDLGDVKIVISDGDTTYPVLAHVIARRKFGVLSRKTITGLFFVWHQDISNSSAAVTVGKFREFLKSKAICDVSANIDWIVPITVGLDIDAMRSNISRNMPKFMPYCEGKYYLRYNLKSIVFDKANMSLILNVEHKS